MYERILFKSEVWVECQPPKFFLQCKLDRQAVSDNASGHMFCERWTLPVANLGKHFTLRCLHVLDFHGQGCSKHLPPSPTPLNLFDMQIVLW